MPAPISITWLALTLAALFYTLWDTPRWYKTPVHSTVIAAITYAPAHFLTMQWSTPAEVLIFIIACGLWATFLHKMVRYALWDLPPYIPNAKQPNPQIAAAYDKLGIPQPGVEVPPPAATIQVIADPEPFTDDSDEWEIFTPTAQPFSTNGVH